MDCSFPVNKMLTKTLALMAKDAEQILHRNNRCIQDLKHTIQLSNRPNLLALKLHLTEFTQREAERNFDNLLMDLYLQFIDHHLKKKG